MTSAASEDREQHHEASRRGLTYAVGAYVLWGFFPWYFSLLSDASVLEIVAERVVWCFAFLVVVIGVRRRWSVLRPALADRRQLAMVTAAAAAIVTNWLAYTWAINHQQAVEGALGYFISPLITVVVGVVALGERLRPGQWAAVGIAAFAVLVMSLEGGRVPWIALVLAATFATFGVIMKFVRTPPVEALAVGMGAMLPPMLLVLGALQVQGSLALGHSSTGMSLLLVGAGVVTAVPMIFFNAAAPLVPLSTMGLLQYINPAMQFLISVFVLHEALTAGRWVGFVLVWLALVVFVADGGRQARRTNRVDAGELVHS